MILRQALAGSALEANSTTSSTWGPLAAASTGMNPVLCPKDAPIIPELPPGPHMVNEDIIFDAGQVGVSVVRGSWDLAFQPHHRPGHGSTSTSRRASLADGPGRFLSSIPGGQLPAYEGGTFGDVNPPVHGVGDPWPSTRSRRTRTGKGDLPFLEAAVSEKLAAQLHPGGSTARTRSGPETSSTAGFLGPGPISAVFRPQHAAAPRAATWSRADGDRLDGDLLARGLLNHRPGNWWPWIPPTRTSRRKFLDHFLSGIAGAMDPEGEHRGRNFWDEEDGFFYDVLYLPDGSRPAAFRVPLPGGAAAPLRRFDHPQGLDGGNAPAF